jgi:hypothetical protein
MNTPCSYPTIVWFIDRRRRPLMIIDVLRRSSSSSSIVFERRHVLTSSTTIDLDRHRSTLDDNDDRPSKPQQITLTTLASAVQTSMSIDELLNDPQRSPTSSIVVVNLR